MKFDPTEPAKPGDMAMVLSQGYTIEPTLRMSSLLYPKPYEFLTVGQVAYSQAPGSKYPGCFFQIEEYPGITIWHGILLKVSPDRKIEEQELSANVLDNLRRRERERRRIIDGCEE